MLGNMIRTRRLRTAQHTHPEGRAFARGQEASKDTLPVRAPPLWYAKRPLWLQQVAPAWVLAKVRKTDRCQVTHDLLLARFSFWQYRDRKSMEGFKRTVIWWNLCFKKELTGVYSSVAEHLPSRKGPVFDIQCPGGQRGWAERAYVRAVVIILVFNSTQHVYQYRKRMKREQKRKETKNDKPPQERK